MDANSAHAKLVSLARTAAVLAAGAGLLAAPAQAHRSGTTRAAGAGQTTSGQYTPTDSGFGEQWDLLNNGQFSGTAGDDIDATHAWDIEPGGNAAVTIGLVDTGVDFDQPSLAHTNLYTQAASGSTQPCAAASYGCSFAGSGAGGTPSDDNGHGTATAGEIFAGWDEGTYAGLAPEATLIVAKVLDGTNQGTTSEEAEGLNYVADRGARVVNVSIAGPQSAAVHEAIADHPETLFVVAAGNTGANDDAGSASYPCADPSPNVICVAASDTNDQLASFSNYGASTVDLAAPGVHIATLTREGSSNAHSGTSFAAPLVTGVAALAFATRPKASVAQVKRAILESVDARAGLSGKTVSGGRLNAYRTLTDLIALSPAAPPVSTSAPAVAGTPAIGAELSASAGAWSGSPSSTAISWERCDSVGGRCQLIAGASSARYTTTEADSGHRLRAEVLATNTAGAEIAFSAATRPVGSTESQGAGAGAAAAEAAVPAAALSATGVSVATATRPVATSPSVSQASPATPTAHGALAKQMLRVALNVKLVARGSRVLRVLLRSTGSKAIGLSLLTRLGAKLTSTRLVLAPGTSRTVSIELPRGHLGRAYVVVKGSGLSLKRSVAVG